MSWREVLAGVSLKGSSILAGVALKLADSPRPPPTPTKETESQGDIIPGVEVTAKARELLDTRPNFHRPVKEEPKPLAGSVEERFKIR